MHDTWILHAMDVGDSDLPAVKQENVDVGLFSFNLIGKCFLVLTCDIRSFLLMQSTALYCCACKKCVKFLHFGCIWPGFFMTEPIFLVHVLYWVSYQLSLHRHLPFWIIMVARIMLVMFCCIVDISRLWLLFQYHHYTRNNFEGLSGC